MKPIDSAVYWIEHVIRHKGAPHLRSAGLVVSLVFYITIKKTIKYICSKFKSKQVTKAKKNK
jgi:hypothetical protein